MTSSALPTVLISPAMAVPGRFYRPLVEAFELHGWTTTIAGRRGIETDTARPSRANDWSYDDEADDLADAIARVRDDDPTRPVVVVGHSLGAQLTAILARRPGGTRPDAIVTVAASVPWFRLYPHGGVVELCTASVVPIVTGVVGHWPTPGFGAPAPRTLMRQWARMVRTGRSPFDDGPPVDVPTLAARLADDRLVTGAAAERFERAIRPECLSTWTYTSEHCPPGGSTHHVGWVRTPGPVVERIVGWWTEQHFAAAPTDRDATRPVTRHHPW